MKDKNYFFIVGLTLFLILFVSAIAFNSSYNTNQSKNNYISDLKLNSENISGCTSVIVHVQPGNDIFCYRRDSGYMADTIIETMTFAGENATHGYKTQNGYFTHTIITENGWMIGIGGRDDPNTNKKLEKIATDIISKNKIENSDIGKANTIIKANYWGHFLIKSPDDNVGITAYDSRIYSNSSKSSYVSFNSINAPSMVKLFKMNNGEYVKVPNNPQYYALGQFNQFSNDSVDAAIKIIGTDIYNSNGVDRRDVITYQFINDNSSKKLDIWASFDGGTLLNHSKGIPDNINYFGNQIQANDLPKIPDKKFLGEKVFQKKYPSSSNENLDILVIGVALMIVAAFSSRNVINEKWSKMRTNKDKKNKKLNKK